MDIVLNRKAEMRVGDITLALAVSRDVTRKPPPVPEYKTQESVHHDRTGVQQFREGATSPTEADPSHCHVSKVSPDMMEHPRSAVIVVSGGPTPENETAERASSDDHHGCVQNSVPLPKIESCDESASDNTNYDDGPLARSVSAMNNKRSVGEDESDSSAVKSNVVSGSDSANISDTRSRANIFSAGSDLRSENEAGSDVREGPAAGMEDETLSSRGICVTGSNDSESTSRMHTPATKNIIRIRKSEVPVADSERSKIEEKDYNCSISRTGDASDSVLPEYLNVLLEGMTVCGDSRCPIDSKPEWLDVDKFRRGQRVAMKYQFGLVLAEMLSLLLIFSHPGSLQALIFTRKSDTPFKSFKRYLSTLIRVRSWYSGDIWQPGTEGHKNIKAVRQMHEKVRQELHNTRHNELRKKITLLGNTKFVCKDAAIWSPLYEEMRDDFQASCPYPSSNQCPFMGYSNSRVFINQMDMAITQFAFVGLFILFPDRFGAHSVSDEDMGCFVHLWRCLGYILGLEDRYNFCNGDLETVRQRTRDIIRLWMKPALREVSRDWEHMTRCLVEGISYYIPAISFEISLLYLCSMLGIYVPRLSAALTFTQRLIYHMMTFTFLVVLRLPGAFILFNSLLNLTLRRAGTASPERLRRLQQKKYSYQENATCTHL